MTLLCLLVCCTAIAAFGQQKKQDSKKPADVYKTVTDIPYREGDDLTDYMKERCRLDIYYPENKAENKPENKTGSKGKTKTGFATVVWFHGGGLRNGNKSVPKQLLEKGIAVVAVNYRMNPKVKSPTYVEDAAASVAWTFKNIARYGGSPKRIFVSGHSAGGYLTSMVGMDKSYLAAYDIDADDIAGLIPFSGHTITHFTVRKEMGIDGKQPIIDKMGPLFHVRKDSPPMLLITGGRDTEMLGRYEENAYFWRMMQVVGHPDTTICELDGFDHGGMAEPAHPLMLKFIQRISKQQRAVVQ